MKPKIILAALCSLFGLTAMAQTYTWTTIVGLANTPAYADGTNNAAFFNNPQGVAVDGAGNVFVADANNYCIRKISLVDSNWVTTTIAGLGGTQGTPPADGVGNAARFYQISTIQLDAAGNLYVQDYSPYTFNNGNRIRKVSPVGTNWVVTTIYKLWDSSSGWAIDPSGNFYTASNYTIIKLTPVVVNGIPAQTNFSTTVLAGFPGLSGTTDGTNIVARFASPSIFGVDNTGTVYLKDNGKLRKVSPSDNSWVATTINQQVYPPMHLDNAGNIFGFGYLNSGPPSYTNYYALLLMSAGTTNWTTIGDSASGTALSGVAVSASGTVYVLNSGASIIRQGVPTSVALGSLQVTLQPGEAVNAGAAWRVDAGLWQTNGATLTNLMAGSNHALAFAPVYGWVSPSNRWVTITSNSTAIVVGDYIQQFGSLQVNLTPAGAINSGAQWALDGGAWQDSGTTLSNLTVGSHTVTFTNAIGYITPAAQTNVSIVPNQTTVVAGSYVALGAVTVNLNPAGAVSAGAQWALDGGDLQASGAVISNLALGSHTISFVPVAGWITPSNVTVTVNSGQTNTVNGNYVVLGSLQVTLNPAGAVSGGAQWQLDGGAFQNSGNVISNLATGAHTIAYSAVPGYITPTNQTLNINPGGTTNIVTTYVALGAVTVNLNPTNAVNAGAQWTLDGGAWQNSGTIVSNVTLGSHIISYQPTTGFITPSNQTVTVVSGLTTNVNATYVALGNVSVTINPSNAITSGAQWALDGGAMQNSGVLLSNLTLGAHTISYLPLTSWIAPSNQVVNVVSGQTTNVTATYTALGSLQVIITPIGAVSAGAVWRVDGGAWQNSGSVVSNLVAGNHTVAFTNLAGWTTPTNQTVAVSLNQTTVAAGIYLQQFGNLQVVLSPAGAIGEGAQWQVDGGAWQNSGATLTNVTVGSHTVSYAGIAGWTAPTNQTVSVSSNQTTRITAVYQGLGSLQVMVVPTGAIVSGAQWALDGGAWQDSGVTLSGLSRGAHTVSYKPASGWVAPASQSVSILANQTTVTNGLYTGLGYSFTTIAGAVGTNGFADGANAAARFDTPVGICVGSAPISFVTNISGSAGTGFITNITTLELPPPIFIADTGNSVIRKLTLTTNGWVSSTIAGLAGYPGNADGTNSLGRFNCPTGVTVDTNGNLYVADQVNSTVRKLTADGTNWVVSTIAGLAGNYGSANGSNGAAARFYYPAGVTVDVAGNVYVADQNNSTIRKIAPVGTNWTVTTIAGSAGLNGSADGTNSAARLYWPSDLTVDTNGNIFVADTFNNTIRKISPVGANYVTTTICGVAGVNNSVDGTNNTALFDGLGGIARDAFGNLFVADTYSSVIRKITPVGTNWVVNTIGGLPYVTGAADGTNSVARFDTPYGVCVDGSGTVYVSDTYNQTIRAGAAQYPAAPQPTLLIAPAGSNLAFNWQAQAGLNYQVEYKTNLSQAVWFSLAAPILATNSMMPFVDCSATNCHRFYRVKVISQ